MTETLDTTGSQMATRTVNLDAGRRAFMKHLGLGAASAAALGAAGTGSARAKTPAGAGPSDVDVLNFALNLEYLEANFYLMAVTGSGLSAADRGENPGQLTGGHKTTFKNTLIKAYAQEIANDEKNHVEFLRAALGPSAAVSMPAIDIGMAFTTLARAAGLVSQTETFDPYANDLNFLLGAYIFEDVGVTAYHGAAGYLADNLTFLDYAAGILAVEAYHAGIVRTSLFAQGAQRQTALISNLRETLGPVTNAGGGPLTGAGDIGVGNDSSPTLLPVDANSIAYDRTTSAVLNVVYGSPMAKPGLFFPAGLNGGIK